MKKALLKDSLREVTKTFARFLSIFLIVAVGVGVFAGIKAVAPNMKNTSDIYYDQQNLMDLRVLSTFGLTEDDLDAICNVDGVQYVKGAYFVDVVTTIGTLEKVFTVHSLPADVSSENTEFINRPLIVEGRYPEKSGECIIERTNVMSSGLEIGSKFTVSSGKTDPITDTLKTDTYTVVGIADSPMYLTMDKGSSEIGSGKVDYFMMVPESDFKFVGGTYEEIYTEALVIIDGAKAENCYSADYAKIVERVSATLENLGGDRAGIRLEEIKALAQKELDKAKEELESGEKEFNTQIKDGQAQLDAALQQLSEAQATLDTEKKNAEAQILDAEKQIMQGEAELAAAQKQYDEGVIEYNNAMVEYGDAIAELDETSSQLNKLKSRTNAQISEIRKQLANDPEMSYIVKTELEAAIQWLEEIVALGNETADTVDSMNRLVQQQMDTAKKTLDDSAKQLEDAKQQLADAKSGLNTQQSQANRQFAEAQAEIDAGWVEYEAAKAEFETKKTEGEQQLEDGREQVVRAQQEIDRISEPTWYILDRNMLYSYVDYEMTADRMDALATIFPVIFFLVAALVCYTTMTRMVDEQRLIMGTYKALGYSNASIAGKYMGYAAVASILGGAAGAAVGVEVFPVSIFNTWRMMYALPDMIRVSQLPIMIIGTLAAAAITVAAAYVACRKALQENASSLMRPKVAKQGKPIFLEKIPALWSKLDYSQKLTCRNIFMYKKRFFMAIIGVIGCSALLVAGFGLNDSISQIVNRQFSEIFKYHLAVKFDPTVEDTDKQKVINEILAYEEVEDVMIGTQINASVQTDGDSLSVTLIAADDLEKFTDYITLRNRGTKVEFEVPESGIVITEKLAKELGNVKVGDTVSLNNGDGVTRKVTVAGITEQYVYHFAYISPQYYKEVFNLRTGENSLFVKFSQTSSEIENRIGNELMKKDGIVASVAFFTDTATKFEDTISSLNAIVVLIIACAALLALVVLYNLTNINISERLREIATFKVLGFYDKEIAVTVYRENLILTFIGGLIGLVAGIGLHRIILTSIEQSGIMYGDYISPWSFLISFGMTFAFTMIVNLFMNGKIKKIPMIESLKSVE
ncbi:MAG: FtsX-like permease family protein [Clostridia bacterium]|nr:FtsX-like permease family protein [Clostridia bacterium]